MPVDRDHHEVYYADKLWNLLPAIYRAQDSDDFGANGPLREMVNRVGAQAAILRRSIDRLWEDQSIETCDDWVVAYIGDLLATNLVVGLDARSQRLDVAKTIYYRRRKGTVAILEEIAADITGWDARVVEFFRRLSRTRHGLDPEIGLPSLTEDPTGNHALQLAEGLVGPLTQTPMGGWADLRNVYGALKVQTAFDEFFHTADFRKGRGQVGWHNIPRLGVFLWRLQSFGVDFTTPVVADPNNPICYSFDPTGRKVPLFAASLRTVRFGGSWVSPQEWQLSTPISTPLLRSALAYPRVEALYAAMAPDGVTLLPNSLGVFTSTSYELMDVSQVTTYPEPPATAHQVMIFPEVGMLEVIHPPPNGPLFVTYHYGFSSTIGAGPYDRRIIGQALNPAPAPLSNVTGGGAALATRLAGLVATGTVSINDSLTYDSVADLAGIEQVAIKAQNKARPLIRLKPPTTWTLTGNAGATLVLEGLFVSGGDLVLKGVFDSVTLTCCTLDPGSAGERPAVFQQSVDGRDLRPCRLWVEAQVRVLKVDRSIIGPIRVRGGGEIEALSANDSIIQGIRTSGFVLLASDDIKDPVRLARRLRDAFDPVSQFLQTSLSAATKTLLSAYDGTSALSPALAQGLLQDLNSILGGVSIYDSSRFAGVPLSPSLVELALTAPTGADLLRLNRLLLEAAYPVELADLALGLTTGQANLSRTTVFGPGALHRLYASECVLDDAVLVENCQDGCVRFTAWSTGSVLPQKYESVEIPPGSPLFTSRDFGQPGYAQLQPNADLAIVSGAEGATISAGAEDGSEMGAFAREKNPVKERSLLIKYQEYMPLGLTPVLVYVT